ncbi:ABC transporter permease [Lichenibacterium minor]|uniref:ABC transporter permease n=1 Tax=Lichenibacterium minor TaxID=2316528 RepID=A0A4Q2U3D9_9HYPH|nr:ABC transporter permease [Lichenibacterium minor]RYC30720.1 ABC transporter permease [Lichenibacterium minor]
MLSFIARRLALAIPTLVLVSLFTFSLQKLLPGDPVLALAGEERSPETLAMLRHKYHLDDPAPVQYLHWIGGVLHGDLGVSLKTEQPVTQMIGQKLPITVELAVLAMGIALLIGIPAGVIAAVRKGTATDLAANVVALAGISVPSFWLGVLMILLFAVKLHWLPASGFAPLWEDPLQNLRTLLMPSLVIGAALSASLMRHTRGAMLAVLRADYIRTARAKGLLSPAVILKHAFRNALVPIVTLVTLLFGELIGGAVLTEQVFTIPGFGKMIVDAVFTRDYAVVQGVVLCVACAFVGLNLLADVLYVLINPRMRASS